MTVANKNMILMFKSLDALTLISLKAAIPLESQTSLRI